MIILIKGPAKSGKSTIANAIRNSQIGQSKGCLLLDETTTGELNHLLEKIIIGVPFTEGMKDIPWKKEAMVVAVNDKAELLDEFEKMVPGFREQLGPIVTLNIENSGM